ncbi:MAG: phosphatidate cytidylyltransferase [Phycisphaeraceae bacterium]
MNPVVRERLFGVHSAFDHPVVLGVVVAAAAALLIAPLAVWLLARAGRLAPETRRELYLRIFTWALLMPLLLGPILLGAAWVILGVLALSLLCYREYARLTGLFREKMMSLVVVVGIVLVSFAIFDHWYGFFAALAPLGVATIAAVGLLGDRPQGYIQRLALAVLAFALFGIGLGHLAYFANDTNYRAILVLLLVAVALNDVFAYLSGKTIGGPRLCPHTSPNKTIGGAVGALVLTTALVCLLGRLVFADQPMGQWHHLLALGLLISVAGQFGDLMLSAVKRDIGVKDIGHTLPGHGGLLDRFDSLLLVAPTVYHYVGYIQGVGLDQPTNLFTEAAAWATSLISP